MTHGRCGTPREGNSQRSGTAQTRIACTGSVTPVGSDGVTANPNAQSKQARKAALPPFPTAMTRAIADVLAQTDYPGLTAGELQQLLPFAKLHDLEPGSSKRERLAATLNNAQVRRGRGDTLVVYLNAAMEPVRYVGDPGRLDQLRDGLNQVLALYGYRVTPEGQFARGARASTLDEAAQLAGALSAQLRRRGCHPTVMTYCREELLRKSLFHAVGEAAKSIPDRLRLHTGSGLDGADLYGELFGAKHGNPQVTINDFHSDSEKSEHRGFVDLLKGIHGHYRNPRAHKTRLGSSEGEQDLLDAFSLFSYVHRRLDAAGIRGH